jgi:hypothetical protein
MGHEWIIDVLVDLKRFASTNDLPLLASQLDQTALIASLEIESTAEKSSLLTRGDGTGTRHFFTSSGAGRRT